MYICIYYIFYITYMVYLVYLKLKHVRKICESKGQNQEIHFFKKKNFVTFYTTLSSFK